MFTESGNTQAPMVAFGSLVLSGEGAEALPPAMPPHAAAGGAQVLAPHPVLHPQDGCCQGVAPRVWVIHLPSPLEPSTTGEPLAGSVAVSSACGHVTHPPLPFDGQWGRPCAPRTPWAPTQVDTQPPGTQLRHSGSRYLGVPTFDGRRACHVSCWPVPQVRRRPRPQVYQGTRTNSTDNVFSSPSLSKALRLCQTPGPVRYAPSSCRSFWLPRPPPLRPSSLTKPTTPGGGFCTACALRASDPPRDSVSPVGIGTCHRWQLFSLGSRSQGLNVPN